MLLRTAHHLLLDIGGLRDLLFAYRAAEWYILDKRRAEPDARNKSSRMPGYRVARRLQERPSYLQTLRAARKRPISIKLPELLVLKSYQSVSGKSRELYGKRTISPYGRLGLRSLRPLTANQEPTAARSSCTLEARAKPLAHREPRK